MLPKKIKQFIARIDGEGYQGETQEVTIPKLTRKMEEYRAGGMLAPIEIDLGLEKLTCEITMGASMPALTGKFGICNTDGVKLRLMASAQSDDSCDTEGIEIAMTGRFSEIDGGSWKAGEDTTTKYTVAISTYKYLSEGKTILDIDVKRLIYIANGVDLYAEHRKNLGMSY